MPGWFSRQIERPRQAWHWWLRVPTKRDLERCPELKHFSREGIDIRTAYGRLSLRVCSVVLPVLLVIPVVEGCWAVFHWCISFSRSSAAMNPASAPLPQWVSLEMRIGILLLGMAATLVGILVGNRLERRYLRYRLRERGVILCIPCGHDMTGTGTDRCAECGKPLALRAPRHD